MQRKFLTNLALLLFLNLLVKPFYIFGIDVGVQNSVGSDSYGFYFAILNFSFLFNILLDLGITQFNSRNIAQNHEILNKHFSNIVIVKFLLGMVYFLITFTTALVIGYDTAKLYFLLFLALNQFLLLFIQYLRSNISGLLLFKTDSFLSVLDRLLMILICGSLLWGGIAGSAFRIEWFIYAQTVSYFITMITALLIVIKKAKFRRLSWNWLFIYSIIRKLYPFSILVFLMTVATRIDTVIIARMLPGATGDIQAGVYAHAYRLVDAFGNYALLFSVLLLPIFSKMIKQNENVVHLTRLAFSLLFTASVIIATATFFYSFEITDLLYNDHLEESAQMLRVIMFAFIPISSTYIFGTLLTANGSLRHLNLVYLLGVLISLGLNIVLVPRILAMGSAYANLSAQAFTALAQVMIAWKILGFKINYNYLFKLLVFVLLVVGWNLIAGYLPLSWFYQLLLAMVLSFVSALLLRLLNLTEIIYILKDR